MKIIKREEHRAWTLDFECMGCFFKLQADETDLKMRLDPHRNRKNIYYVNCVNCGKEQIIDEVNVPQWLKTRAERNFQMLQNSDASE